MRISDQEAALEKLLISANLYRPKHFPDISLATLRQLLKCRVRPVRQGGQQERWGVETTNRGYRKHVHRGFHCPYGPYPFDCEADAASFCIFLKGLIRDGRRVTR